MSQVTIFGTALFAASIAAGGLATAPSIHAQTAPVAAAPAQPADMAAERKARETELRAEVRANPNDPNPHDKLAHFYAAVGNYPAAEAELRELRRISGPTDDSDAMLARLLLLEGKTANLFNEIKPADRQPKAKSVVRLTLGQAHYRMREIGAAEPLLRDAVRLDPTSIGAHLTLARLFLFKGQLADAHEQVDLARGIDPKGEEIDQLDGDLLLAQGSAQGAIDQYTKILKTHHSDEEALSGSAYALLYEDKLDEAKHDIDAALKSAPKSPRLIYLDCLLLAREGNFAAADTKLISLSKHFGQGPEGYYLQGMVKFSLGQYAQADTDFGRVQGMMPDASEIPRIRAEVALRRKDPDGAVFLLKPEVDGDPSDRDSARMLARAYVAEGHLDEALAVYEQMAAPPPPAIPGASVDDKRAQMSTDAQSLTAIDKILLGQKAPEMVKPLEYLRRGDIDDASSSAEALVKNSPDDPDFDNLLGSVRLAQNCLTDAEEIFRNIVQKKPDFTQAAFNLAEVLVAEKKSDEAKTVLQGLAPHGH